jgi:cytochrome P450 family 9
MAPVVFRTLSFSDFVVYMYNKLKGHKYGGVYQFLVLTVLLRDPELIKMVTVKDFEHFLDHQAPVSEEAEPMFGKALFNLKGKQITACTVFLLPLNRSKSVSKTQWFNWPVTKIITHLHLTHPAQQKTRAVKKKFS